MAHRFHDTISLGGHAMPGAWSHLLPEEAGWLRLPRERLAACGSCPPVAMGEYAPACRCCGYLPQMTNFALGFALQSPSADAVRAVIADGHALPFGLSPCPRLFAEAIGANAAGQFGQEPSLACPFKDPVDHRCGVYAYRNSVCSTFFCRHGLEERGEELWSLVQAVVGTSETAIAQWVMGEAGRSAAEVFAAMDALAPQVAGLVEGERAWTAEARATIWGDFAGREEEFFLACAERVVQNQGRLVAIASRWTLREPAIYQQALKEALPEASQEVFPQIDDGTVERIPFDELWYELQVNERELWALPFGALVQLAEGTELPSAPSNQRLPILIGGALRGVQVPGDEGPRTLYRSEGEVAALALFVEARPLDGALLAAPQIVALDDARAFLAEQIQCGVLVPA